MRFGTILTPEQMSTYTRQGGHLGEPRDHVHYAATRIGAVSNPLIPIYRERELGFMVGLAKSRVMVVPAEFRGFSCPDM